MRALAGYPYLYSHSPFRESAKSLSDYLSSFSSAANTQPKTRKQNENSKSSKDKSKTKIKKFLEEDSKWAALQDDEVISLISGSTEAGDISTIPTISMKGRLSPIFFLVIFVFTNIWPMVVSCYHNPESLDCLNLNPKTLSPIHSMIYQIGNMACTLLSIIIFSNMHGLQKADSNTTVSEAFARWYQSNFVIGCFGALLWMVYVILGTRQSQGPEENLVNQTILNLYFVTSLAYSLFNQIKLKARIEDPREKFTFKKLLFFFFKNTYYFLMMAMILLYIAMEVFQTILAHHASTSSALPIIAQYIDILKVISILMSQFYIALYHVDINCIYEGGLLSGGVKSLDSKLNLNRL